MIDYQRTIDNIRSILASAGASSPATVTAVAEEYAAACGQANERLRKCGTLLSEGLRSEAIQHSEAEPNLLTLATTLDFPEIQEWRMLLHAQGVQPPEPLLVDVAGDLNEAYAQEQPLATQLRQHRLLALTRGPLRDRIGVLRRLSALDQNNPVWKEDLRAYERARHQEIRKLADEGCRQRNLPAVETLVNDLQSSGWLEPPAATLIRQVTQSYSNLVLERAQAELKELEPQLNDAFSQFDAPRGRALRDRWHASAKLANLTADHDLSQRAAPALEWLDEQDRDVANEASYNAAVAALDQALDAETGPEELERLAHAVLRHDRPIPPLLDKRYRARAAGLELARSRRLRLIVASVAITLALAAAGIGYAVMRSRHAEQVAGHVAALEALLSRHQFDDAEKHLGGLTDTAPAVAADAKIQAVKAKMATAAKEEQDRQSRFAESMESAEKAGADEPDRDSLARARSLAFSDAEKARVQKLESAVAAIDRRQQSQRDSNFLGILKELNAKLDGLNRANPDETLLADIRQSLTASIAKSGDISPPVLAQGNVVRARIDSIYKSMGEQEEIHSALGKISATVGDVSSFKQALEQFAKEYPDSSQAVDLNRAAGETELWKEVDVWNRFLSAWRAGMDTTKAQVQLTAAKDILRDHGKFPIADDLERRIPHLEAVARRLGEGGTKLHAPLNELFTDPLVTALWMIEVADDSGDVAKYYLVNAPPKPRGNQSSIRIKYIIDFSREPKKDKQLDIKKIRYSGQAPQSIIAKSVMDELAKVTDDSWESTYFRICSTINSNQQLEPILKVIFLQKVLDVACQGSESMKRAFGPFQEVLGSVSIDPAIPWMDPENKDANRVRELIEQMLQRLPSLRSIGEKAAVDLKSFKAPLGAVRDWIGWLTRENDGKWQCRFKDSVARDGNLFIVQPSAGDGSIVWAAIGTIAGGVPQLGQLNSPAHVQGRPVFFESATGTAVPK